MDIDLEEFTKNSETISKELFNFCGYVGIQKLSSFMREKIYIVKLLVFHKQNDIYL